jgi:threonine dehydrogenase-like Zn-dependent dehydrogenase
MRCAVWLGGREFRIERRASPQPGPGQVRLAVHACGVCLTEVHGIDCNFPLRAAPPLVLGHEFVGIVDAVGAGVVGVEVGSHVVGIGSGGFAEQVVLPAGSVFTLPEDVPLEHAALLEPIVACAGAIQSARLAFGSSVLITGAGPMGLMLVQLARRGGAARVLLSEPSPERGRLAQRLGAEHIIDPSSTNVVETARQLTGGKGVDAAFETVGHADPLRDCLEAVGDGGTVVIVGVNSQAKPLELDLYRYHPHNLTLRWSWGPADYGDFARAVPRCTPWLQQLQLDGLISHRFTLDQITDAFEVARTRRGLKVLVLPRASS